MITGSRLSSTERPRDRGTAILGVHEALAHSEGARHLPHTHPDNSRMGPQIAAPPFDQGDTIIRSSDHVSFFVHKAVISLASPVFADTFTLGSPSPSEKSGKFMALPHLTVSEDSQVLRRLLSWCDPRCSPTLESPDDIFAVLQAADKYCMDKVMKHAADILMMSTQYVEKEPMKVFAVAARYGWQDLAKVAARHTLNFTWEEQVDRDAPDIKHIPAVTLRQLEVYQLSCRRRVVAATTDLSWFKPPPSSTMRERIRAPSVPVR